MAVEPGVIHISSHSCEETIGIGAALGRLLHPGAVVVLTGDLGAGKTQFTKGVARALGVTESVTSPTFNILLVYTASAQDPQTVDDGDKAAVLQHFDLYRLEDASELDDIDYFGLLEGPDTVSVVEWGDKFPEAMPEDYLLVELSGTTIGDSRGIRFWANGQRSAAALRGLVEELGGHDVC